MHAWAQTESLPASNQNCSPKDYEADKNKSVYLLSRGGSSALSAALTKAEKHGFSGKKIVLNMKSNRDGHIVEASLKESTGFPELDDAVISHAKTYEVTKGICGMRTTYIRLASN